MPRPTPATPPESPSATDGIWVRKGMDRLPPDRPSGWKIHVSATPRSLAAVLERAAPVLDDAGIPYKVAASPEIVEELNSGSYGLSQVGKVLTAYPFRDEAVAPLGAALARALRGLPGPRIIHDIPLAEDAPVYARFGAYGASVRIDGAGRRRRTYLHPELGEALDPTDGGAVAYPALPGLPEYLPEDHLAFIRDRFLVVSMLHLSAKGGVFLALDREQPALGVQILKSARAWTHCDGHDRDARWALAREHAWLAELAGATGVPPAGTLLEGPHASVLARPHVAGDSFWECWTRPDARRPEARSRMARLLDDLDEAVAALHARGCIVRDLSPANIIDSDKGPVIVDFELAHGVDEEGPPYRRGTLGFYDPRKARGAPPEPEDDRYALRQLRDMAATGVHPAWKPSAPAGNTETFDAEDGLAAADLAFGALLDGLDTPDNTDAHNLYSGSAGLFLAGLEAGPARAFSGVASGTWERLAHCWERSATALDHIPGCYFGASGPALALLALGRWRERGDWVDRGFALLAAQNDSPSAIPDLCHGWAGLGAAWLAAHRITEDPRCLESLRQVADRLVDLAQRDATGIIWWPWPEGETYGGLGGQRYLGFAHGVAGIFWLLASARSALGPDRVSDEVIQGAAATLAAAARPVSAENPAYGRWWPVSLQDEQCWNAWCHGTPGVAKALAKGVASGVLAPEVLTGVGEGIASANSGELGLCHGVASRLDAFTDLLRCGGSAAQTSAEVRNSAAADADTLRSLWPGPADSVNAGTDMPRGLMTGPAGILRTLLRYDGGVQGPYGELLP